MKQDKCTYQRSITKKILDYVLNFVQTLKNNKIESVIVKDSATNLERSSALAVNTAKSTSN